MNKSARFSIHYFGHAHRFGSHRWFHHDWLDVFVRTQIVNLQ